MSEKLYHITESQLEAIVKGVLQSVTVNNDDTINHPIIQMTAVSNKERLDALVLTQTNTVNLGEYYGKFYIPMETINTDKSNYSQTTITIAIDTDFTSTDTGPVPEQTHKVGLVIPPGWCERLASSATCVYISGDIRKLITEITLDSVIVDGQRYLTIDLGLTEEIVKIQNLFVHVNNHRGFSNVELEADVIQTDSTTTIVKSSDVSLYPPTGFNDIVDRDKLIRSDTIANVEVISIDDYNVLEAQGKLDEDTLYNIPE